LIVDVTVAQPENDSVATRSVNVASAARVRAAWPVDLDTVADVESAAITPRRRMLTIMIAISASTSVLPR
jgi:hypothetical protein